MDMPHSHTALHPEPNHGACCRLGGGIACSMKVISGYKAAAASLSSLKLTEQAERKLLVAVKVHLWNMFHPYLGWSI